MTEYRPSVSAVLLSYNCVRFIADALRGVLNQDYENLEIIVSDDASEDGTVAELENTIHGFAGERRIDLRRRRMNAGNKSAHLNDVLRHLDRDIIVFFDGDDISEASRVRRIVDVFCSRPEVQAVYSAYSLIDADGCSIGWSCPPTRPSGLSASDWFARIGTYASGGTLAVRRCVVEAFGPLFPDIHEDITLPFRASLLGDVAYLDEPLVKVRRHPAGLTQDFAAYASLESYRARFVVGVERARQQRDARLADLRAAEALMPHRVEEFEALRTVISRSANDAEDSLGLVSASFLTRLRTFLQLRSSKYYVESFLRDLSLVMVPRLYLPYKRRRLGSRPDRVGNENV